MELAKKCGISDEALIASWAIDLLTNEQRKTLREKLENAGAKQLPRNLYFNYETQEWI